MLRPTKFSVPDKTVLAHMATILEHLRQQRTESYSELRELMRSKGPSADALFIPALNLLYLLGLIEYRSKSDSFEYVGPT